MYTGHIDLDDCEDLDILLQCSQQLQILELEKLIEDYLNPSTQVNTSVRKVSISLAQVNACVTQLKQVNICAVMTVIAHKQILYHYLDINFCCSYMFLLQEVDGSLSEASIGVMKGGTPEKRKIGRPKKESQTKTSSGGKAAQGSPLQKDKVDSTTSQDKGTMVTKAIKKVRELAPDSKLPRGRKPKKAAQENTGTFVNITIIKPVQCRTSFKICANINFLEASTIVIGLVTYNCSLCFFFY